jgi:hypothetical protein
MKYRRKKIMYRKFSLYPHRIQKKNVVSEGFAKVYDDGDDDDDDWKSESLIPHGFLKFFGFLCSLEKHEHFYALKKVIFSLAAIIKNRHFFQSCYCCCFVRSEAMHVETTHIHVSTTRGGK